MSAQPKITFGIIVLNGEPFAKYCLQNLYPHAHEIIVVEGASPGAKNIATADGHSRDGTLETLKDFKAHNDPNNKIQIITAEDEGHKSGFWPGEKDEQSRAYAKRATGNYLWQVDIDEFYKSEDIKAVITMLQNSQDITAVSFKQLNFWGGLNYTVDGWYLRDGGDVFHRLFKWGEGYDYVTHRPPTVTNAEGVNLRDITPKTAQDMTKAGIFLYHYSLLFPKQVQDKCDYYQTADWAKREGAIQWAEDVFDKLKYPFRVHNVQKYPSWLNRYHGTHPLEAVAMMKDIQNRTNSTIEIRKTNDIEKLLNNMFYQLKRFLLKQLTFLFQARYYIQLFLPKRLMQAIKKMFKATSG